MGETACPIAAWLRKLGPYWTLSERTFEHCVSPSRNATATTGHATHRKSQLTHHPAPLHLKNEEATGPFKPVASFTFFSPSSARRSIHLGSSSTSSLAEGMP